MVPVHTPCWLSPLHSCTHFNDPPWVACLFACLHAFLPACSRVYLFAAVVNTVAVNVVCTPPHATTATDAKQGAPRGVVLQDVEKVSLSLLLAINGRQVNYTRRHCEVSDGEYGPVEEDAELLPSRIMAASLRPSLGPFSCIV